MDHVERRLNGKAVLLLMRQVVAAPKPRADLFDRVGKKLRLDLG